MAHGFFLFFIFLQGTDDYPRPQSLTHSSFIPSVSQRRLFCYNIYVWRYFLYFILSYLAAIYFFLSAVCVVLAQSLEETVEKDVEKKIK